MAKDNDMKLFFQFIKRNKPAILLAGMIFLSANMFTLYLISDEDMIMNVVVSIIFFTLIDLTIDKQREVKFTKKNLRVMNKNFLISWNIAYLTRLQFDTLNTWNHWIWNLSFFVSFLILTLVFIENDNKKSE
ncbi:hypothetical protein QI045_13495 [Staphylococcus saprophyticus]|uniref:hypothetical protein n=2 Tax=Staphylococcus TaxID=1279 RepID=UPI000D1F9BD8|nr:hypothetical protein [Staphylococcus saprophyticus]MDW4404503.1 hypothetical protein [Staphylococcus saprophyticus]PTK09961.1 hypothetical protein BUZ75_12030 [Staphylococcus saprophyticus]